MPSEENKKITDIVAEQVFDSRNCPTLKVTVYTLGNEGTFLVPSGKSTGKYEACELRDPSIDEASGKKGINIAIEKIHNIIKPALIGQDVTDQSEIDKIMIALDGTPQKTNLGGNSMIGVSIACAKLSAKVLDIETFEHLRNLSSIKPSREVPFFYFNLINGGSHVLRPDSGQAKTKIAFQEYHIVPQTTDPKESVKICQDVQNKIKEILKSKGNENIEYGDEGGVVLPTEDVLEPLSLLLQATNELDYKEKIKFALDVAASSFYDHENHVYNFMGKSWKTDEMIALYKKICDEFDILSIEDPLDEEDFEGFAKLQKEIPEIKIIGDDLTVTNSIRLKEAIDKKSVSGIIIKPNQIGTLSETISTIKLARENNIECIVSHRSGETIDDFIADLACAFLCFGLKSGALGPKERDVKYERIINIINKK